MNIDVVGPRPMKYIRSRLKNGLTLGTTDRHPQIPTTTDRMKTCHRNKLFVSVRACLCLCVAYLFSSSSAFAAPPPPTPTLLFAPSGAAGIGISAAGAEDLGSIVWTNPAGIVHVRYREMDAGVGSNSGGFNLHAGYFNPGRRGLPLTFRFDGLTSNFPIAPGASGDKKFDGASLFAGSIATGGYLFSRLSAGAAFHGYFLQSPGGNGLGAAVDLGLIYRPGEIVRFSYGLKNIGPDVSLPGHEGDLPMTQLFGVHVKSPARGNMALDIVVGWPSRIKGFWSVAGTYKFTESFGMRFVLAQAAAIPVINGRGLGFFLKTWFGKIDVAIQQTDVGNMFKLSLTRHSSLPPAQYPRMLQTPPWLDHSGATIIYGEAPAPKQTKSRASGTDKQPPSASAPPPSVAVPVDDSSSENSSDKKETRPVTKSSPKIVSPGIRKASPYQF